jgi:predicted DsbA family dithiol-disulfide isomerase
MSLSEFTGSAEYSGTDNGVVDWLNTVDDPSSDPRFPQDRATVVVFSDLNCSFAHVAVHRLHQTRRELGLEGRIWFDHRAFPLELFNMEVNARPGVDSEISVVGALQPDAGWRLWQGPDWTYPVTMLPALEAVQAAKSQSWAASEQLDRALRRAFWGDGRCISMRHIVLEIAAGTGVIDVPRLADDLDAGRARAAVMEQYRVARDNSVVCSPHVFLYDGSHVANPGVDARWLNGDFGVGFPEITRDRPEVYRDLLVRAADLAA